MKRGKKSLLGLVALAAVAVIGTSFASWVQELQTGNEFMTARYDTKLVEHFNPPDTWRPGMEQEKEVLVSNEGTVPVLAKVVMNQTWIRKEDVYALRSTASDAKPERVKPYAGEQFPLSFETDGISQYAAILNLNRDAVVVLESGLASQESLHLGIPSVKTVAEANGKWLLVSETPDTDRNYTFYYVGKIVAGAQTPLLLKSVTLNPVLDRTIVGKDTYYVPQPDGSTKKVTVENISPEFGYDSAKYTLDIHASTVQATSAAVSAMYTGMTSGGKETEIVNYLASEIAESGVYDASEGPYKKLVFNQQNGTMVYTPYRTETGEEDGNWFMSFTNMVPGGVYKDKLAIENDSRKKFNVYMQVVPREQDAVKDELLNLISMKVSYQGTVIYEGKATGASLVSEEGLQRVVPLGTYASGAKGTIDVELSLDPTLTLGDGRSERVAGVLSKIDWKFMVTESGGGGGGDNGGGGGDPVQPGTTYPTVTIEDGPVPAGDLTVIEDSPVPLALLPKTGDTTPLMPVIVTVFGSGIILLYLGMQLRKKKEE